MNTYTFRRVALAASFAVFMGNSAQADTYTAIASGNFSSAATWLSGSAPASIVVGDNIQVPSGITVTLDRDLQLNGPLASIVLNGTLVSSTTANNSVTLTSGSISGSGAMNVDSVVMAQPYGFNFTGAINAKNLVSLGTVISAGATMHISSALELHNAVFSLNAGSLSLANGATVVISGGGMSAGGGGAFMLTTSYNVRYQTGSVTTGVELLGTGLTNVEVDVPSSSAVSLGTDLTVKGMLTLTSGTLNMNNHDLSFAGNGNVSTAGSGTISSTNGSNISFVTASSLTGGLRFASNGNTVNNLTINLDNSGNSIMLASDLNVDGVLALQSGRVDVGSNALAVNGSVSGGSSGSYVVTGNNGRLIMSLGAGVSHTYPVGTGSNYAPAVVQGNAGTATSMIGVGVNSSVFSEGTATSGVDLAQNQALVNATWFMTSAATSLNLNLRTMWNANMEVNGFDRAQLYISHYTNANWDVSAVTGATTEGGNMYSAQRNNITSLSPFAVMGKDAVTTSVGTIASANSGLLVYPNPAINTITIPGNYTTAKIYSMNGTLVKTTAIANNTITVTELPAGYYTLSASDSKSASTTSFIKQ